MDDGFPGVQLMIFSMVLDFGLLGLGTLAITFVPVVKILRKAGYSGWWGLLWVIPAICIGTIWVFMPADLLLWIVPPINAVMVWVFAFANWPSLAKQPT
jgi:uncharacterized membrane protein YhaH (DUF805 family)